jgi:integrase
MQGYFRKRGSTWSFSVELGRDPLTGKRKQKTVGGFKTKKEAQAAAAAIQLEVAEESYIVEKDILLATFVTEWIKLYQHSVKVSTVRVREHESAKLTDFFNGYQVKQITRKMYQDFLMDLHEKGFASNTIAGIHSTGKMIFAKAVEIEVIKNDPTQFARPPRAQKTVDDIENENQAIKYLEKDQLSLFLKTAKEQGLERDYVIFLTLAYSGIRVGELCALKWTDLDRDNFTLKITKTYYNPRNVTTEYQLLTPKTSKSIRTIELDPVVFRELEEHRTWQNEIKRINKETYHDKDFLFAKTENSKGYPELIKTIHNRMRRLLNL